MSVESPAPVANTQYYGGTTTLMQTEPMLSASTYCQHPERAIGFILDQHQMISSQAKMLDCWVFALRYLLPASIIVIDTPSGQTSTSQSVPATLAINARGNCCRDPARAPDATMLRIKYMYFVPQLRMAVSGGGPPPFNPHLCVSRVWPSTSIYVQVGGVTAGMEFVENLWPRCLPNIDGLKSKRDKVE